jgi:mono/diheme cytochrome c family protein
MRSPRSSRPLRRTLAALLLAALPAGGQPAGEAETASAEELLFLLQYIAVDYENAVQGGQIVSDFEYREMLTFSRLVLDQFEVLRRAGAAGEARAEIAELAGSIQRVEPANEVRELTSALVARLLDELDVAMLPVETPDLERGAELYRQSCAACHGGSGAGDGLSAPGMDPPPTSFLEARMNLLSPHQIQGAISFGTYGTAMPSYRQALTPAEIWDIAFFTMTLREDFAPSRPDPDLPVSLADVAARSAEELLASIRRDRPDIEPAHIDYYRRNPPPPAVSPAELLARAEVAAGRRHAPPPLSGARDEGSDPPKSGEAPWIGVSLLELSAARRLPADRPGPAALPLTGVYVDSVVESGPAADAGMEAGDCLLSIDAEPILSVPHFRNAVSQRGIGRVVSVEIFRGSETFELLVAIESRPASVLSQ